MTYQEWFSRSVDRLTKAGCDSPAFEIRCILEDFAGKRHPDGTAVSPAVLDRLEQAVAARESRRPLQYILGNWDFLHLTLTVGEGVLVPRPDTEVLCETVADWLSANGVECPRVLDVCAGSGCVGLGIASLVDRTAVTAVELSDAALPFLRTNAQNSGLDCTVVQADVLQQPPAEIGNAFDVLVANPPYIPTADLNGLMPEVRQEPQMALDGGEDGLLFYRRITEKWLPLVRKGGLVAFEIGQDQHDDVAAILTAAGVRVMPFVPDLGGILRVVCGEIL